MFTRNFFERLKYWSSTAPTNVLRMNWNGNQAFAEIFIYGLSWSASSTTNVDLIAHADIGNAPSQKQVFFDGIVMADTGTSNCHRMKFCCGARWSSSTMNQTSNLLIHQYPTSSTFTVPSFVTDATYIRIGIPSAYSSDLVNGMLYGMLTMQAT